MTGNDNSEEENAKFIKEVDAFITKIGERCHSVRLVCVIPGPSGKVTIYTVGNGDAYSQIGAVREWLMRDDAITRHEARKDADSDES